MTDSQSDNALVDSGMSGEAVEVAELFWAQLPTAKKWTSLATHEKALVCHLLHAREAAAKVDANTAIDHYASAATLLHKQLAAAKADAERLAEALEKSQLGLTVLANMLKRIGLERGEEVAVEMHRGNAAAIATYRENRDV